MAEEWRRKSYYRTRVLIPVDEVLDSAFGDCLVCLTGGQLNLVRNLLLYAERRSTFVSEYEPNTYLAPTTEEWDDLQAVLADLEGNLMDCEQFTSDLQEILDWVRKGAVLPGGTFSEAEEAQFPYDDVIADDELTPAEEDACAIAQLWFQWGYETITEYVLPATRWGFDYLIPALFGFIVGAAGGPVGVIGAYAIAEFIQELLEIFYRGAESNLANWMDSNKEELVCVLYGWLVIGGDASSIWQHAMDGVITPAEDISYGDKLMLSLFMGSWAGSSAQVAFDAETEWATSNVEAGYCDECEAPPHSWHWADWNFGPDTDWDVTPPKTYYYDPDGWLCCDNQGVAYSPEFAGPPAGDYVANLVSHGTDSGSGSMGRINCQWSNDGEAWFTWFQYQPDYATYPSWSDVEDEKELEDFAGANYIRYQFTTLYLKQCNLDELTLMITPA